MIAFHYKHIQTAALNMLLLLDAYSTLDQRGRGNTLDNTIEPDDKDAAQVYGPTI